MKLSDLDFNYPENLVAQRPEEESRVMWVENKNIREITKMNFLRKIPPSDVLVINDTKVIKRRVFGKTWDGKDFEFLFVNQLEPLRWQVLCRSGGKDTSKPFHLPGKIDVRIIENGIPQVVTVSEELPLEYFDVHGELPIPPYIQKARSKIHNLDNDEQWYQTGWAEVPGSQAAPTASFHFSIQDLKELESRGVIVKKLTLHVGLGTFLPVRVDDLDDHKMHSEYVHIPAETWTAVKDAIGKGRKIWALGTTVCRALEACAQGGLPKCSNGFQGSTDILIQEGHQFQIVDRLLTNFHQPRSTLLALVCGFCDKKSVLEAYKWAIGKKFRLFSYGDLSVWLR